MATLCGYSRQDMESLSHSVHLISLVTCFTTERCCVISKPGPEDTLLLLLSLSWESTAAKWRSLGSSGGTGLEDHLTHVNEALSHHPAGVKPPDDWGHMRDPRWEQENSLASPIPNDWFTELWGKEIVVQAINLWGIYYIARDNKLKWNKWEKNRELHQELDSYLP